MSKIRTAVIIVILLLFATVHASGQDLKVTEKVLPNGLKVLLKEEHKAPVVTFQVWYRVGSRNEKLGKTGMSHLLEHMMFKGTANPTACRVCSSIPRSSNRNGRSSRKNAACGRTTIRRRPWWKR